MSEQGSLLGFLSDPRLAPYATGDIPAWLWSADATRILWGNPAAAAIFNAASSTALTGHTIDPKGSAALQIARLAGTLPHGAAPRLERLRGFGGRMGGALMCALLADLARRPHARHPRGRDRSRRPRLSLEGAGAASARRLRRAAGAVRGRRLAAARDAGRADHDSAAPQRSPLSAQRRSAPRRSPPAAPTASTAPAGFRSNASAPAHRSPCWRPSHPVAGRHAVPDAASSLRAAVQAAPADRRPHAPPPPATAVAPQQTAPTHRQAEPRTAALRAERRQPLRFVWQMDDDSRFTLDSDEFKALIGPQTAAALGQPWNEIATALGLDPDGQVARAFASRDTWSGITVAFPVDGTDTRLAVELSGLPVFDRDRNFRGYRGFGVCRDVARISELTHDAPRRRRRRPRAPNRRCSATSARRCRRAAVGECRAVSRLRARGKRADADAGRAQRVQRTGQPSHRAAARPARTSRSRRRTPRAAACAAPPPPDRPAAEASRSRGRREPQHGRRRRPAPDPRPAAGRRAGLSARQADLRQPRLPRLDRLRASCTRWRRPADSTRCSSSRTTATSSAPTTARSRSPSPPIRATRCRSRRGCSPRRGKANPRWC